MDRRDEPKGGFLEFWKTVPGFITAVATLLTALAAIGIISSRDGTPVATGPAFTYPPFPTEAATQRPVIAPPDTPPPESEPRPDTPPPESEPRPDTPPPESEPRPDTPPPASVDEPERATADVTLIVGIRPSLGQLSETMELELDGNSVASWTATEANPTQTFILRDLAPGVHDWTLRGEYTYLDYYSGRILSSVARGDGTISIADGIQLGIEYINGTEFRLTPFP